MKWKRLWSREYSVQYSEAALYALGKPVQHLLPVYMEKQLLLPDNQNQCFYFEEKEDQKFMNFLVEHFSGDQKKFATNYRIPVAHSPPWRSNRHHE